MKPTQLLDAFRNIKKRFVSFQSIAVTVVMGVAGLLCIFFMENSFTSYATDFYKMYHFKDLDVISTAGITGRDLKKLREIEGVAEVEGYYYLEGILESEEKSVHVTMLSATEKISIPSIHSGRMPEHENECALDPDVMELLGISIGDSVTLCSKEEGLEEILKNSTYTVTGSFIHPDYLTKKVENTVLLDKNAFQADILEGGYLRAYIELEDEKEDLFRENEYFDRIRPVELRVRELAGQMGVERSRDIKSSALMKYNEATDEADQKLTDSISKIEEGEKELSEKEKSAQRQFADAQQKLSDGETELLKQEVLVNDSLADAQKKLEKSEEELEKNEVMAAGELAEAEKKLEDGERELSEQRAYAEEQIREGSEKLAEGEALLQKKEAEAEKQLKEKLDLIIGKEEELNANKALVEEEFQKSAIELAEGEAAYEIALAKLNDGENQYHEVVEKIQAAKKKLDEASKKLDEGYARYQQGLEELQTATHLGVSMVRAYLNDLEALFQQLVEEGESDVEEMDSFLQPLRDALNTYLSMEDPFERADYAIDLLNTVIEAGADLPETIRSNEIIQSLLSQMASAISGLENAVRELRSARQQLEEREAAYQENLTEYEKTLEKMPELDRTRAELDEGWKELKESRRTLNEKQAEYNRTKADIEKQIKKTEKKLKKAKAKYEEERTRVKKELEEGRKSLEDSKAQLAQQKKQAEEKLEKGRRELSDGRAEYEKQKAASESELQEARKKLDEGKANYHSESEKLETELQNARAELEKEREQLEEEKLGVQEELEKARKEIEEGRLQYEEEKEKTDLQLAEAKERIDGLEDVSYVVVNRNTNESFVHLRSSVESIHGFGLIFVPIFAIVGCLVIFITLATIIDEQKQQVGALKAMGFRKYEIRNKYLLFGLTAVSVGSIFGIGLSLVLEKIVLNLMSAMYNAGELPVVFVTRIMLFLCIPTFAAAAVISWNSCRYLLKSGAVSLMNGSEPAARRVRRKKTGKETQKKKSGKERSLYSQMIINNILTDKTRVMVSIVVIIGSVILIGVGLSLRTAFNSAFASQEKGIYRYELRIGLSEDADEQQLKKLEEVLSKHNVDYLPAVYRAALYDTEEESAGFYILCADENEINQYIDIGKELPESGILVPEKFAELHDLSDGITIYDESLIPHKAEVQGSYRLYVGFIAIMSPKAFAGIFDEELLYNSFYCSGITDEEELKRDILRVMPDAQFESKAHFTEQYKSTRLLFNMVAIIMILISASVTFTVMINLTNIMVNRRLKELLTLRVNGYSRRQVVRYLLAETMLINIAGIAAGVLIGILMNDGLIRGVEAHVVKYVRTASFHAWGGAALLNIVFSLVFNLLSFRKVGRMKLTDISKY